MSATAILTVNAGSSSVRLAAFDADDLACLGSLRYESPPAEAAVRLPGKLAELAPPPVVAAVHRVVHGGTGLTKPVVADAAIEATIEALGALAPLHNPAALAVLRATRQCLGAGVPQIAVFDTAFYADLPAVAQAYALPPELSKRHGIRRYGFHGIAHQAMATSWRKATGAGPDARLISLQLGAGCSVTAVRGDRPVDTSMGFSPLEGLVMATRSGDVDPGALLYLLTDAGLDASALGELLNHRSGLLGLSGLSGSVSDLVASGEPAARFALDVYVHRITRYIGAYLAVLGGADAILFGGGVGENVPSIRARVLDRLAFAGVRVEPGKNDCCRAPAGPTAIGVDGSRVAVWVIPVDEASIMARAALALSGRTT